MDDSKPDVILENIVAGSRVLGIVPSRPVDIISVTWFGTSTIQVTARDDDGALHDRLVSRSDEPQLRLLSKAPTRAFDGDDSDWRLAAEALRIDNASYYDPMVAVTSSDLDPLPHQLRAVYEHMLPKAPLRFLLADDPGAGKTIMAGLYIKELMLRSEAERILIVAPGGLATQWQDELNEKFGLHFEILTRQMVDLSVTGNVFKERSRLIARMDMLSRDEELIEQIRNTPWDVIIVDEAHRMSAHYSMSDEIKYTKRYALGQALSEAARNFVLMTATPHSGKPDDFQLFLALLDGDRFEGKARDGIHKNNTDGIMRRMVKEDLLTMEGRALFPERRAYTVGYELSDLEQELYEAVTQYVKEQMALVQKLNENDERKRGNTVGFALTVLQRRLASSPEAIFRSLERRQERLKKSLAELKNEGNPNIKLEDRLDKILAQTGTDLRDIEDDDSTDELDAAEREAVEENVVSAATAARTAAELEQEIIILDKLIELARRVRVSEVDVKWNELRDLLTGDNLIREKDGSIRKIIIFTEHKDTLEYLQRRITDLVGDASQVERIDGSTKREERKKVQERFMNQPNSRILLATDAAGEGLNLQKAHLMVNYDLPWNPNRIEQRFGRIHRIGQEEVCHLWNLVATNTREGDVYRRLLEKLEEMRQAFEGRVFDVLGEAFDGHPLRELLMDAVRYGDDPARQIELERIIDERVSEGIQELLQERALHSEIIETSDMEALKEAFEDAQARKLQPYFIKSFFIEAFKKLGGQIRMREEGRFEITHIPARIIDRDRQIGTGAPIVDVYERITFDRDKVKGGSAPRAVLVAPGHPLMQSVISLILEDYRSLLKQGTIFIDQTDMGETPRLLVGVKTEIVSGLQSNNDKPVVIDRNFEFVEITPDKRSWHAGPAPYLDYEGLAENTEKVRDILSQPWLEAGAENIAVSWVIENQIPTRLEQVRAHVQSTVAKVRTLVTQRLSSEINYWDTQVLALTDKQAQGQKLRRTPDWARNQVSMLEQRLTRRLDLLQQEEFVSPISPAVISAALVVPLGLVERLLGERTGPVSMYAKDTTEVDRRAIALTMRTERELGRNPIEKPHNNKGYDIASRQVEGPTIRIEVKGRIEGADVFTVTRSEILEAKNLGENHRLALVKVSPNGQEYDEIRYVVRAFDGSAGDDFAMRSINFEWKEMWDLGTEPK